MKQKSHLLIKLHLTSATSITFIELCGSELAATLPLTSANPKQAEVYKQYATQTFNSLSLALTRSEIKGGIPLVQMLGREIVRGRVILCCSVNPGKKEVRHNATAIKFCAKIKEAVAKRLAKNVKSIENDLATMSMRLSNTNETTNKKDLISKFNTLR